ncbi:MAG: glucuronate isomerase [Treponema sp.]|jgi:glucuronate isomerase|nr:glucuronate isomerase [Treponema sp.]
MKKFMDKDFLLATKTAQRLYHEAAAAEPIFDYHCHLIPREIGEDRRFPDLAYIWLGEGHYGDHYKWRVMRANGVDERLITGTAEPYDRFLAWAETMPRLLGNPLYHWTHLELQRYFDIHDPLNRDSAPAIWKAANEKLKNDPALSVYGIFKKFKVFAVGTTDDPADTLEWHEKIAAEGKTSTRVLPSFRPDKAVNIDKEGFTEYIARLGAAAGKAINNLGDLLDILGERINLFDQRGCRAADHGLEYIPFEMPRDTGSGWEREVNETLTRVLAGETVEGRALESYKTFLLYFFGRQYHERGWVMQLHLSAIRNTNSRALKTLGPDTGYDAVHDHPVAANLARFLDLLEGQNKLPKTILYSLNVKDFYPLGTIMGGFQGGGIPGKMQLGSAWWFLDHKDGMEDQMKLLGNIGLLSRFVGMLTDSRSFLSYPRHEYFRRILCNILGTWAEEGEIPNDPLLLENMVKDISFRNAKQYFG